MFIVNYSAAEVMEEQVDAEMKKMNELDEDDIEAIRQRRLKAMQRSHAAKQEFIAKGHGGYDELPSEKDFFDKIKDCKRAVVHFYRPTTLRCEIFGLKITQFNIKKNQINILLFWHRNMLKLDLSSSMLKSARFCAKD